MSQFGSVDEVLDFAIKNEEQAAADYYALADKMEHPWMADTFRTFAREEEGHKAKLLAVKKGKTLAPSEKKIQDLKIGDYLVEVDEHKEMNYQEALIVAMKKEKAAFKLYMDLAEAAETEGLKDTFLALAQEEAKHKLRFEIEYDQRILTDN